MVAKLATIKNQNSFMYIVQVILACYKEFEERVGLMSEKIEVRYMMLLKIM